MILVDTSIWVDHLRRGTPLLEALLQEGQVLCHPWVIGELACGNLRNREGILGLLQELPRAIPADDAEALVLIAERKLAGKGLGWIDVHLLASALLSGSRLWTADKALQATAGRLGVHYEPGAS